MRSWNLVLLLCALCMVAAEGRETGHLDGDHVVQLGEAELATPPAVNDAAIETRMKQEATTGKADGKAVAKAQAVVANMTTGNKTAENKKEAAVALELAGGDEKKAEELAVEAIQTEEKAKAAKVKVAAVKDVEAERQAKLKEEAEEAQRARELGSKEQVTHWKVKMDEEEAQNAAEIKANNLKDMADRKAVSAKRHAGLLKDVGRHNKELVKVHDRLIDIDLSIQQVKEETEKVDKSLKARAKDAEIRAEEDEYQKDRALDNAEKDMQKQTEIHKNVVGRTDSPTLGEVKDEDRGGKEGRGGEETAAVKEEAATEGPGAVEEEAATEGSAAVEEEAEGGNKLKKLARKIQLAANVVQKDAEASESPKMKKMAKKLELAAHKVTGKHISEDEAALKKAELKSDERKKEVHKEVSATMSKLSANQKVTNSEVAEQIKTAIASVVTNATTAVHNNIAKEVAQATVKVQDVSSTAVKKAATAALEVTDAATTAVKEEKATSKQIQAEGALAADKVKAEASDAADALEAKPAAKAAASAESAENDDPTGDVAVGKAKQPEAAAPKQAKDGKAVKKMKAGESEEIVKLKAKLETDNEKNDEKNEEIKKLKATVKAVQDEKEEVAVEAVQDKTEAIGKEVQGPSPDAKAPATEKKPEEKLAAAKKVAKLAATKKVEQVIEEAKAKANQQLQKVADSTTEKAKAKDQEVTNKAEENESTDEVKQTEDKEKEEAKEEESVSSSAVSSSAAIAPVAGPRSAAFQKASDRDPAPDVAQEENDKAKSRQAYASKHIWPVPQVKVADESLEEQDTRHKLGLKRVQAQLSKTVAFIESSRKQNRVLKKKVDKDLTQASQAAENEEEEKDFVHDQKIVLAAIDKDMTDDEKERAEALKVPDPNELMAKSDKEAGKLTAVSTAADKAMAADKEPVAKPESAYRSASPQMLVE